MIKSSRILKAVINGGIFMIKYSKILENDIQRRTHICRRTPYFATYVFDSIENIPHYIGNLPKRLV